MIGADLHLACTCTAFAFEGRLLCDVRNYFDSLNLFETIKSFAAVAFQLFFLGLQLLDASLWLLVATRAVLPGSPAA